MANKETEQKQEKKIHLLILFEKSLKNSQVSSNNDVSLVKISNILFKRFFRKKQTN